MPKGVVPRSLLVLLGGHIAGVLERDGADVRFTYDETWRRRPDAVPVSIALPLAGREYRGRQLEWYLQGILPDGERRLNALAFRFGVQANDPYALLAHIGEDCAGAVQFVREERIEDVQRDDATALEWLSDHDLATLLRELRAENADGGLAATTGQFSLAGALAKVALRWDPDAQRWARPNGRAATTHILKPPLGGIAHHVENEHLSLRLARAVGLPSADSRVLRVEDEIALVVTRFDRQRDGSHVTRLHAQDCSQALGANPRLRYAAEGAPGVAEIVRLLRDHSSRGLDDVLAFVRAVAFNWMIGGTDAHPRNYTVHIGAGGAATLAPLYDVSSALALDQVPDVGNLRLAMAIGGATRLGDITHAAWETQARTLRLDVGRVRQEITGLCDRIIAELPNVAEGAGVDPAFAERFVTRIGERVAGLRRGDG